MIIRVSEKTLLVLSGSFVVCALAVGIPYFSVSYGQANLPDSLFGWGLLLALAVAAGIRMTDSGGFLATFLTIASVPPVIVMARVIFDTALDSTTHNLWPFELVIAGGVSVPIALAGTIAGSLARLAMLRWTSKRADD